MVVEKGLFDRVRLRAHVGRMLGACWAHVESKP